MIVPADSDFESYDKGSSLQLEHLASLGHQRIAFAATGTHTRFRPKLSRCGPLIRE